MPDSTPLGSSTPVVAVLGTGTMGAAMAADIDSVYVQIKGPKMIADDLDDASFPLAAAAEDAGLITETRSVGLRLGVAETVRERLQLANDNGPGRADVAATYRMHQQQEIR
jgi:3-hydroxyisobutyrate dehydrogenase